MRCDAHVHVVASIEEHPQIAERTFIAAKAPLERLQALGAPFGIDHFVITQPSFYGTDNAVLLSTLDAMGGKGRGVAVVAHDIAIDRLLEYRARGVAALRVNLYSPAAQHVGGGSDDLTLMADLAGRAGLHVEVIAPLPVLVRKADLIRNAPVPVVIDHYGLPGSSPPDSRERAALLELLHQHHVWIKLSSPYRLDHAPLNLEPDRAWLQALLAVAGDRCIWGSDWPHPPPHSEHKGPHVETPYRAISYAALVEHFMEAVADPATREAVMGGNAARLYRFGEREDR